MKKRIFTGAATALVTPMNADGSVNFGRLKTLINEQIESGIDALVICGTTGEKSTLRYDEHLRVIEESVKSANGRVPIIAGTGSNDTVYSVELCEDAASVGADAFLMVTPYYNKTSQQGLIAHYNYIADYYAGASPEMQNLMEQSALVILDINDAIANGYVKLSKDIQKILEESGEIAGDEN